MKRVCFLFNHDQVHQVAHSLPIALSLARRDDLQVVVATTNPRLTAEVTRLAGGALPPEVQLVQLGLTSSSRRWMAQACESVLPIGKLAVYGDNLGFFAGLHALVVTEKTSLLLKTRYGLEHLFMIHTRHGAGDRAVGFDKASARFDHVLASGRKIVERLVDETGVAPERVSIVGYPKFDIARADAGAPVFEDPGRPTVLYNPHVSPHLSSWYAQGRRVLDYFLASGEYNLIFAPHVMLFQRPYVVSIDKLRISRAGRLDAKYAEAPNIHVDLGSAACTDMTYTDAADIYLGDVSSQVYEFLREPRPCLFLNAHQARRWDDPDFAHWQAGPVISSPADLEAGLRVAVARHGDYLPDQRKLFDHSFDLTGEPSSERAARAIHGLIAARPSATSDRTRAVRAAA